MDTSEKSLETIISKHLVEVNGYEQGHSHQFDRDYALMPSVVEQFLVDSQPEKVNAAMCFCSDVERRKFFDRLSKAIAKKGVVDVLRNGFKYNGSVFTLYYPTASPLNPDAQRDYERNRFMVVRQLFYSKLNRDSIDLMIAINGLPIMTLELKNAISGQVVDDAITQYKQDRDPQEPLLQFKRCAVHFAVDDREVYMCTKLDNDKSIFMPFNKGVSGGKGNPVNPNGFASSYLWEDILSKHALSEIIENFAQVVLKEDKKTRKVKEVNVWPRYHQLDCVKALVADTLRHDVGQRYLVQHSAGSGKSHSITWLCYQLCNLKDNHYHNIFDGVIVLTDRVNLDEQIRDDIKSFAKLPDLVGWADDSETLGQLLTGEKPIVVSVINKFSYILDTIGTALKGKQYAIIIDEAHSSQSGNLSASVSTVVSGNAETDEEESTEDKILKAMEGRKLAKNVNYYAFTATPKNKTLAMFGTPRQGADGNIQHVPFHEYTMKQAIEEGFILDVLRNYTTFKSFYNIVKSTADDPHYDKKKSLKKIRSWVEGQPQTIERKSEIIVEHFCQRVANKIGGKARAMVVTSSIERAIAFFHEISKLLTLRNSQHKAIVAFTPKIIDGELFTDEKLNGFKSSEIEDNIETDPYRILIVADKYQTGYDQPLLHTMYVDKVLCDVKAVQTLSRLNRCYPMKNDTFVLDFANEASDIQAAFQRYYKTTILSEESDINKLNDLTDIIEDTPFYSEEELEDVVSIKINGADSDRPKIDAILDKVVERFKSIDDDNWKVEVKSSIKSYCRFYPFISAISPFSSPDWEKRFIFYAMLVKKLPKLVDEDFTQGLLQNIDLNSYKLERQAEQRIELENEDAELKGVPVGTGHKAEPELLSLSEIIKQWNEINGSPIEHIDEVLRQIDEVPSRIRQNSTFVNALRNSSRDAAQIHFNDEMMRVIASLAAEKTEFAQLYFGNNDFQNLINNQIFSVILNELNETSDIHLHVEGAQSINYVNMDVHNNKFTH